MPSRLSILQLRCFCSLLLALPCVRLISDLLERTVVMQFRNWSSGPQQLTKGIPQRSALSPSSSMSNQRLGRSEPSKIFTLADDGLIYKTSKDSQEAAEAVQQQLDSVSQWCHDTRSLINPDKAQTLWCTLDDRASGKLMPAITVDGAVIERTSHLSSAFSFYASLLQAIDGVMSLGRSKPWMGQASMPADRATSKPRSGKGTQTDSGVSTRHSCQETWGSTVENGQQAKQSQRSSFSFKKTANRKIS